MLNNYNLNNERINLVDILKDTVSIEAVAQSLNLTLTKSGDNLQGDCPTGHASANHQCFSVNLRKNFCYCFNCSRGGSIIDLVGMVKGTDFKDSLKWLTTQFKPELLPALENKVYKFDPEMTAFYRNAMLFEEVFDYGKKALYEPVGQSSLDALISRGYAIEKLKQTEWIYFPPVSEIRSHLENTFPALSQDIQELPLNGAHGDTFRLALPYRDRRGQITGFVKRAIERKTEKRWDSTKALDKNDLFGLHRIKKTNTVVVVEGYPDALYLPTAGVDNIVAVGAGRLSEKHLDGLHARKITRVILSLDNDPVKEDGTITGVENTEAAVRMLIEDDIEVFVIDPPSLSPYKDADELVAQEGPERFKTLIESAELGAIWLAKRILAKNNTATDIGKTNALTKLFELADSLTNPLFVRQVVDLISSELHMPIEMIQPYLKEFQERKAKQRLQDGTIKVMKTVAAKLTSGEDAESVVRTLTESTKELILDYERTRTAPVESLQSFLRNKQKADQQRKPGDLLGYKLSRFPGITSELYGLQAGLYILGAYPNVGKTTLMVNEMLDVLQSNPQSAAVFYSMDDSRETIINRCLAFLTQIEINNLQYQQSDPRMQVILDEAYDYLYDLITSGRLSIYDASEVFGMDDIELGIRQNPYLDNLVVFIDGLYNVGIDGNSASIREENITRANSAKFLSKSFGLPVLTSAELRKKSSNESKNAPPTINDIMESGKYGYNADVVFLLYPQDSEMYEKQPEPFMTLKFGKNKMSSFRGEITLKFNRAKSSMEEVKTGNTLAALFGVAA